MDRTSTFIQTASFLMDQFGILTLGRHGFENAYCLALRRDRADAFGLRTALDLAPLASRLTLAGDPEFFGRQDWLRVRSAYRLEPMTLRSMDSTFMYSAVRDGQVDVIGAYTTDGRIAALDLVILEDPQAAFPPYDAVLLLSPRSAGSSALIDWLQPILNAIDDGLMREANRQVDMSGRSTRHAAEYLAAKIEW